mmetsp:Transcript_61/g.170  ORF Transcript_61/g.170 Transcript_61/m.170 type:complete len:109 (-) Transcript_61:90-416(-)
MGVVKISGTEAFKDAISGDHLVVVDFFAEWCGPCRMIAPMIEDLSKSPETTSKGVKFYKIDVDESTDVARDVGISAMPTFHGYKKGERVFEVIGANYPKLKEAILSNA